MPKIFDNIEQDLLPALKNALEVSERADFCIGYFNLRGWRKIDRHIESWSGESGQCCRLLIGMQKLPQEILRDRLSIFDGDSDPVLDNQKANELKRKMAEEFKNQLATGAPNNEDETGLKRLAKQIKSKKVVVKLFLRHPLHAKLYLMFRKDKINEKVGYLGSSNLTLAGLINQGELNVDVMDDDACVKLATWFKNQWDDRWCIDISEELVKVIEESWIEERDPYSIYIKIAHHLSKEARAGLNEFKLPSIFKKEILEFQEAAVKIAARHLNRRGGVILGDVVGLGKTLMATVLARMFEDDYDWRTLILCPSSLVSMWEDYKERYNLRAKVLSTGKVINELPNLRRHHLVIIDESHNFRNRDGGRYQIIRKYIEVNASKCVLLSATPYNKTYIDLSNQLRLFLPEDKLLSIKPEKLLKQIGEIEFMRRYQTNIKTLAAFDKSEYSEDWQELMRWYLVRRTRSFIKANYSKKDKNGREYLLFGNGEPFYFPERQPKTIKLNIDINDKEDQYAKLLSEDLHDTIKDLNLPRYGLGNYIKARPEEKPSKDEEEIIDDLSRAGRRLIGFCRTNLLKRMESSGPAFLISLERHILRNYVFLHALENDKELPIGIKGSNVLDKFEPNTDSDINFLEENDVIQELKNEEDFREQAKQIYKNLEITKFRWLKPHHFQKELRRDLELDCRDLTTCLDILGTWHPEKDEKLNRLAHLIQQDHAKEKILVFSQFSDTIKYVEEQLKARGIKDIAGVTGASKDPTSSAIRFSPKSNNKSTKDELRVLLATDVLSEGQNLQDAHIVVNYDLPWGIIRLIQRAGRVDRIGQKSDKVLCYSFFPPDGIEKIIRLRQRVLTRLKENAEVVGTDEKFFEDESLDKTVMQDIYNEKSEILDDEKDNDVDLQSYAYQIWKDAIEKNPSLQKKVEAMPASVYSAKMPSSDEHTEGALVYVRTSDDEDALAWIDRQGNSVTENQFAILKAAECSPETPAKQRDNKHHELVEKGVAYIARKEQSSGGALGSSRGARFQVYERLRKYQQDVAGTMFDTLELRKVIGELLRYPLRDTAKGKINHHLRDGTQDEDLAKMVIQQNEDDELCLKDKEETSPEPQIICSMGLSRG